MAPGNILGVHACAWCGHAEDFVELGFKSLFLLVVLVVGELGLGGGNIVGNAVCNVAGFFHQESEGCLKLFEEHTDLFEHADILNDIGIEDLNVALQPS